MSKTLSEKFLYKNEFETCTFINSIENIFYDLITNIMIILKDNIHIHHISNYENFTFDDNTNIEGDIPLIILLGGSSYKIYGKLFNEYFGEDTISLNENIIDSIDYDFSILVNKTFNKKTAKEIIIKIIENNNVIIQK